MKHINDTDYELTSSCCACIRCRVISLTRVPGVVYGSVSLPGSQGQPLLESAVNRLLQFEAHPTAKVLWSLRYTQLGRYGGGVDSAQSIASNPAKNIIWFPPPSLDLAFDDTTIDIVRAAWKVIMGVDAVDAEFMSFEDREGATGED